MQGGTPQTEVRPSCRNSPTSHSRKQSLNEANRKLDCAFASRGFHKEISVRALNGIDEWIAGDYCRLMIEVCLQ